MSGLSSWPDKTGSLEFRAAEIGDKATHLSLLCFFELGNNTMISLQQQQKPANLLVSWKFERGEHSDSPPPATSLSSPSLGCALETSMKVWQVSCPLSLYISICFNIGSCVVVLASWNLSNI